MYVLFTLTLTLYFHFHPSIQSTHIPANRNSASNPANFGSQRTRERERQWGIIPGRMVGLLVWRKAKLSNKRNAYHNQPVGHYSFIPLDI